MDFQALRKEYENAGIDRHQMLDDPIELLRTWTELAIKNNPGDWFEPNAMTLATTDRNGHVSARIVLLKEITDSGVVFYTNYGSAKARAINKNSQVAIVFHWPYLGRQVRLVGTVEKTSREKSEEYFHRRPRGSQIGALISEQSAVIDSRETLEAAAADANRKYEGQEIPLPENWGGYHLNPVEFEFWQGREDRIHDRFRYSLVDSTWKIERLAP